MAFLYGAVTAHRYIKEGGPHARNQLDVMVDCRVPAAAMTSPESKLDIYTDVLQGTLTEQ